MDLMRRESRVVPIGVPSTGAFSSAVLRAHRSSPRQKHLVECNVRIYALIDDDTNKHWTDMVTDALRSRCKSISIFNCAKGTEILPQSILGKAVEAAKEKDIVIITFYHRVQDRVDAFVRRLREANPDLYVVFVTGSDFVGRPEDPGGAFDVPGKGIADLVVGKNQLSTYQSEASHTWLATQLTNMLANAPIGQ